MRDIDAEELEFFANQLRKSGRYKVFETDLAGSPNPNATRIVTPTLERVAKGQMKQKLSGTPSMPILTPQTFIVSTPQAHFADQLHSLPTAPHPSKAPKLVEFSGDKPEEYPIREYDLPCLINSRCYGTPGSWKPQGGP